MNHLSFDLRKRYYPSVCPVCSGDALEVDVTPRKAEFQCPGCGAYEITLAARSAIKGMSQKHRALWLLQARKHVSS